jgi:uncharacterized metal-binding protein
MNMKLKCTCNGAPDLMFCCSGAADTAEIADRAVRKVHREGAAKMFCLAGIGGRVELILLNTKAAKALVAVDGCDTDCAKRTLERAGFKDFTHIRVTDLGMEKGKTEVTSERIETIAARVRDALCAPAAGADV